MEECGPCPVFASFTLAFALQLRKKHGKNLSQGKKNLRVQYTYYQNTHTLGDAVHVTLQQPNASLQEHFPQNFSPFKDTLRFFLPVCLTVLFFTVSSVN